MSQASQYVLAPVAESHIVANVPSQEDFKPFLQRDLENYFKTRKAEDVIVKYEMLRNGPTQSGVSYPKFYLWVIVQDGGRIIEEGAVRVAAIERQYFEVTNYLTQSAIKNDSSTIFQVFPRPVCNRILGKL